jgi:hypothetical protein
MTPKLAIEPGKELQALILTDWPQSCHHRRNTRRKKRGCRAKRALAIAGVPFRFAIGQYHDSKPRQVTLGNLTRQHKA